MLFLKILLCYVLICVTQRTGSQKERTERISVTSVCLSL
jgi:hypothetical protein